MCTKGGDPTICKHCQKPKEEFYWKKSWKFSKEFYRLGRTITGLRKPVQLRII